MSYGTETPYGTRRRVDPLRIWAGGVATALVAGGVGFVGVLVIRALFRVPGLHRLSSEYYQFDQLSLAITAAAAALLATALLHLLMVGTPRAPTFFAWIMALFVVATILQEMLGGAGWFSKLLFSALYLVIGLAITSLLTGVGKTAVKYVPVRPEPDYRDDQRYNRQPSWDDQPTRRFPPSSY